MSQQEARTFLERFATDDTLRREVLKTLEGDGEASPSRLVQLGAGQGLTFTVEELAEAWQAWRKSGVAELTDRDLDAVAGGIDQVEFGLQVLQQVLNKLGGMNDALTAAQQGMSDQKKAAVQNIR
jgi:predicted ribosomally synthesized peptide with nif11-like leader